jgi:hypothetical protein
MADDVGADLSAEADIDGEESGAGSSRRAALQRAIPSWAEAIGFIVESNMSTRSQRRPSARSGGGREGSSRGRSRGRRNGNAGDSKPSQ